MIATASPRSTPSLASPPATASTRARSSRHVSETPSSAVRIATMSGWLAAVRRSASVIVGASSAAPIAGSAALVSVSSLAATLSPSSASRRACRSSCMFSVRSSRSRAPTCRRRRATSFAVGRLSRCQTRPTPAAACRRASELAPVTSPTARANWELSTSSSARGESSRSSALHPRASSERRSLIGSPVWSSVRRRGPGSPSKPGCRGQSGPARSGRGAARPDPGCDRAGAPLRRTPAR